ncbi:hypothetical protein BJG88_08855 [Staphylococcus nepalensis]|uniref:hypothetical protein n=1 Tax=Staphylococcus nepalensis TaxID=214473 RepID=UPI000D589C2B|nr:hypothetical protein [Staphylococcus nepalensis]AWI44841.1 hypothetical protein BJG88_08855 [Staphylococcus nepalensis]
MSKKNRFWGAISVLLVIIFIGAILPESTEEKNDGEKRDKSESIDSKENKEEKEQKTEEINYSNEGNEENSNKQENNENTTKPQTNTVYGQLTDANAEEVAGMYYNQDDDLNYIVGENKKILQIEKSFEDLPLDENMDQSLIKEHTLDYMEDDASISNTVNDSELEYYSPSIDETYNVVYEKNNENKITNITISSF